MPGGSDGLGLTPIPTLGMRGLTTFDLTLEDVFVGDDLVLGEPGRAWSMMFPSLNNARMMLLGLCCGMLDGILEEALAYATGATHGCTA